MYVGASHGTNTTCILIHYIYTITCIHWYFDLYINVTQKARAHIGLVSKVMIFNISFFHS